jgi:hypothetical protein
VQSRDVVVAAITDPEPAKICDGAVDSQERCMVIWRSRIIAGG